MRTKGAALATASNWISNYIVVQITPTGIASLGWRFYLIWMTFNAIFVPVRCSSTSHRMPHLSDATFQIVWMLYPETSHRHLEDIDRLYREENPVFVFRNKEAIQVERPQRFIDSDQERMIARRNIQ